MATRLLNKPEPPRINFFADQAAVLLLFLFGTTTLLQAFIVPTGSMEGTVLVGDHVFVDKLAYAPHGTISGALLPYSDVKRGDVIVFRYPLDIKQTYVKRVVGIPGDRVRFEHKRLILNGKAVREPYTRLMANRESNYLDNFPQRPDIPIDRRAMEMLSHVRDGELVVPEGQYFAIGDNRDNSADSRFWGFVPRANIVGKPLFVFWSYDAPTERLIDGNINPDHVVDIALNFFVKTRWRRTFKLVRGYDLQSE
jgi:signal peptidase I